VGYSHYYLSGAETTTQAVIPVALLSGIAMGSQITGMAFRADSSAGPQPGSTDVWTSFDVIFAAPSATVSLNSTANFANNLGPDATTVRSGSLSIDPSALPSGGSPNAFGPMIAFTTPYTYLGTDLIIQIRTTGSADLPIQIDTVPLGASLNNFGYTATQSNQVAGVLPVVEFQIGPAAVPEPSSFWILCVVLLLIWGSTSRTTSSSAR
jgi:hypothetical protein